MRSSVPTKDADWMNRKHGSEHAANTHTHTNIDTGRSCDCGEKLGCSARRACEVDHVVRLTELTN